MSTEALEQAFGSTRQVLATVKPDQLDLPTPCASWDVRELVNHIVGASHWFALCTEAGQAPEDDQTENADYASLDAVAAFDEGIKRSLAAFGAEGALDKIVTLPFGAMPGRAFMGLATVDTFTHGWDLAKATGQPTDLEPQLAAQLLQQAAAMVTDQFRGPNGVAPFGPAVAVEESAPAADRLAGFLGRHA